MNRREQANIALERLNPLFPILRELFPEPNASEYDFEARQAFGDLHDRLTAVAEGTEGEEEV